MKQLNKIQMSQLIIIKKTTIKLFFYCINNDIITLKGVKNEKEFIINIYNVISSILTAIVLLVVLIAGGDILIALVACLIVLLLQFLISPWITDLTMKFFYKATKNDNIPDYLRNFIQTECQKHGVTFPKLYIIHDGAPNAFTYGRTKKDARLVLTEGIFNLLTPEEVVAVVGHELGHIVHMDMMFMTAAQAVPLILYAIYEATTSNNDSDSNNNKAAIVGYIAYLLYIISQYIILYLSRTREYYADSFSIDETKNPNSLAEALVKIGFGLSTHTSKSSKGNALGIFDTKSSKSMVVTCMDGNGVSKTKIKNAMKWEMWNPWAKWFEFNSTHPLISKRLLAISKRSIEFGQEPYITFDLQKPESYMDDFLLELLLVLAPFFVPFITLIFAFVFHDYIPYVLLSGALLFFLVLYIRFLRSHKDTNYIKTKVENLLGEVKVSGVTSIPCELEGIIIGRGNPGCIFNEDFVIKDESGIIFLDYNQPLNIVNKIFALFKSEQYFNKTIKVTGWYRRSPVPYVEIKSYEVDGKVKKIWTYPLTKGLYIAMFIIIGLLFILV